MIGNPRVNLVRPFALVVYGEIHKRGAREGSRNGGQQASHFLHRDEFVKIDMECSQTLSLIHI